MAQEQAPPSGPDLTQGVALSDLVDRRLVGHVGNEEVLLVRAGSELFAIGAHCSHYHGPLADGVVTGETVRCPWHHACFDLRSGEALRAPALSPVECWKVEQHAGQIFVKEKRAQPKPRQAVTTNGVGRIVIVGGGAAGFAAAEMLRRRGFGGSISMLSQDDAAPVDRPNLSKDYLAGSAPEDWLPLRPDAFYTENDIDLRLDTAVVGVNVKTREVVLANGERLIYDRLLLATGAEPVRLPIPGADQPHVHTLRSLADCRAIIRTTQNARRALVIGASFIGLEAAAGRFDLGECEHWVVTLFAGPAAEEQEFGTYIEDSDLRALQTMATDLGLDLSTSRLAMLRSIARSLVARDRLTIRVLAEELLRRGEMSGDEICILLA